MSRAVWQHKREDAPRRQAWNLPQLPDGFLPPTGAARLYVAIRGHWRGYFRIQAFHWTPTDRACPFALLFAPDTWTPVAATPAPQRTPCGFTLDVPAAVRSPLHPAANEIDPQ
jgi:hypothetical protein